jgi:hypothetical protein
MERGKVNENVSEIESEELLEGIEEISIHRYSRFDYEI